VTASVRRELQAIDPAMPPPLTVTFVDYMGAAYFAQRTAALLLGVLAVLALALASVGLYSLVAFGVSGRRQEIGVRMALGAASPDILRLILAEGARMAEAGVAVGALLAVAWLPATFPRAPRRARIPCSRCAPSKAERREGCKARRPRARRPKARRAAAAFQPSSLTPV